MVFKRFNPDHITNNLDCPIVLLYSNMFSLKGELIVENNLWIVLIM